MPSVQARTPRIPIKYLVFLFLNPILQDPSAVSPPSRNTLLLWGETHPERVVSFVAQSHRLLDRRLTRWIGLYGLSRVGQVLAWALSAPPGSIRVLTAWVETALRENWAPRNSWLTAWQARQAPQHEIARTRAWLITEAAPASENAPHTLDDEWTQLTASLTSSGWAALDDAVAAYLMHCDGWSGDMVRRLAARGKPTYRRVAVTLWRRGQWPVASAV